jgi:hypothetical protein
MSRGLIPALLVALSAIIFFSLGNLLAARQAATTENDQIAALRAEVGALQQRKGSELSGTTGRTADPHAVAHGRLHHMGAPAAVEPDDDRPAHGGDRAVSMLRDRRQSFVEMYHATRPARATTAPRGISARATSSP